VSWRRRSAHSQTVAKQTTGLAKDRLPVHSFRMLLGDLATFAATPSQPRPRHPYPLTVFTRPTPIHHKACDLLDVGV
jgi:hypothetical protein